MTSMWFCMSLLKLVRLRIRMRSRAWISTQPARSVSGSTKWRPSGPRRRGLQNEQGRQHLRDLDYENGHRHVRESADPWRLQRTRSSTPMWSDPRVSFWNINLTMIKITRTIDPRTCQCSRSLSWGRSCRDAGHDRSHDRIADRPLVHGQSVVHRDG